MAVWSAPTDWSQRPVAVLGGGVLGRRIASCWASGNHNVKVFDPSANARNAALQYWKDSAGLYTAMTRQSPGSVTATDNLADAVHGTWLVIEAVPERLEMKLDIFSDLEKLAPNDCILATNSSSYKSRELTDRVSEETKARILNAHYMMPPDVMVVELMTDGQTSSDIFPFLAERLREVGSHPLIAQKESTGFVMNRIWAALKRETLSVLAEGVSTPEEVDRTYKELYGTAAGPCHMMDAVGLDTVALIEEHYVKERGLPRGHLDWLEENYIKPGKLGNKSEKGGLIDRPASGSQIQLIFLNIGLNADFDGLKNVATTLSRGQVLALNVDGGTKPVELVGNRHLPDGIEIFRDRMYWTEMGTPGVPNGGLYSARLDGSDVKSLTVPGTVHTPKQCAIDEVNEKLYFTDREGLRIMRSNMDGSDLDTLVQVADWKNDPTAAKDQQNWCVGIAISNKLHKMFWTQKGFSKSGQGRILSASLDMPAGQTASDRKDIEVVQGHLAEPIDLAIDEEDLALYWTDRGELPLGNTLNRKYLEKREGEAESDPFRIMAHGFGEAIGLKLDAQKGIIYVADLVGRVWTCDAKQPGRKTKIYEGTNDAFTGITLRYV